MKRLFKSKKGIAIMAALLLALTAGSIYAYESTKTLNCKFGEDVEVAFRVNRGYHQYAIQYTLLPYYTKHTGTWEKWTCMRDTCARGHYWTNRPLYRYDKLKMKGDGYIQMFYRDCGV